MISNKIRQYLGEDALLLAKKVRAQVDRIKTGETKAVKKILSKYNFSSEEEQLAFLIELNETNIFNQVNLSKIYETKTLLDRADLKVKKLERFGCLKKGTKALELGAGNGELLYANGSQNFELICADYRSYRFDDFSLRVERERNGTYKELNLEENLEDLGGNFDLIFSSSVMEHFRKPEKTIEKCYNSLKPGGILYGDYATFGAPYATHRKIFTGIPYVQAIVPDNVAFKFFYEHLKVNNGFDRYTGEKVFDNPYPEVNRLMKHHWLKIFSDVGFEIKTLIISPLTKFNWFLKLFDIDHNVFPRRDLFMGEMIVILRKPK